jgi:O-acetyl-ADP-ribose deacetylase (regulator of RNase III)
MIKHVVGDLVRDAEQYEVIMHGCNCFCVMGAGIAPQIKAKFPEAYAADCATTAGDENKMGTITHTTNGKPIVVNMYTQYDTKGRRSGQMDFDYDAFRKALKEVRAKFSGKMMAMPKIGAGLAGGDWEIIERILEDEMRGEYVTVVTWENDVK